MTTMGTPPQPGDIKDSTAQRELIIVISDDILKLLDNVDFGDQNLILARVVTILETKRAELEKDLLKQLDYVTQNKTVPIPYTDRIEKPRKKRPIFF